LPLNPKSPNPYITNLVTHNTLKRERSVITNFMPITPNL